MERCPWCEKEAIYRDYHDQEWGRPLHDDHMLFEFLVLEGAQAGLSWITILKRRPEYRRAFCHFNPYKVAQFNETDVEMLMENKGIIRNRLKIKSAIQNAKAFLKVQKEFSTFDAYIWSFVDGTPIVNNYQTLAEVPAQTDLSVSISKDLKKRGFNFVGPTIMYAFMQATGMVNDHLIDCFCHEACQI